MFENLTNGGGTTLIAVDAADLKTKMRELFREVVDEFQAERDAAAKARKEDAGLLTVAEVCNVLHVCKTTLWRWNNNGLLPVVKIGSKAYYRMSDVERLKGGGAV